MKSQKNFSSIQTKLAGVTFGDCQANIEKWGYADIRYFRMEREPENIHDPNAVGVWFLGDRLGYLPKTIAAKIAPLMDSGRTFSAEFVRRNEFEPCDTVGLTVRIEEATENSPA